MEGFAFDGHWLDTAGRQGGLQPFQGRLDGGAVVADADHGAGPNLGKPIGDNLYLRNRDGHGPLQENLPQGKGLLGQGLRALTFCRLGQLGLEQSFDLGDQMFHFGLGEQLLGLIGALGVGFPRAERGEVEEALLRCHLGQDRVLRQGGNAEGQAGPTPHHKKEQPRENWCRCHGSPPNDHKDHTRKSAGAFSGTRHTRSLSRHGRRVTPIVVRLP